MSILNDLGVKHKTDKSTITHCYLGTYEKYIESWRDKEFIMWELGVAAGASIRMWREYFPNAKIYGIDNDQNCAGEGILIGSQIDKEFLDKALIYTGTPDIVIDDASHYGPYTIETFKHLFPKIANDGWYVVEDTHCFYDKTYGEAPEYGQGMSEVFKFFNSLSIDVDVYGRAMTGDSKYAIDSTIEIPPVPEYSRILDSIHIHPSLRFFKRK